MTTESTRDRPLVLWGPMGVGKTTVGALVAARSARPFIDLDAEIEKIAGASAAAIFRDHGEAHFRAIEQRLLREALASTPTPIIALGGGALVDPEARTLACRSALVVGLRAPPSVLSRRIGVSTGRPVLGAGSPEDLEARLHRIAAERRDAYATAHTFVDATASPERVAEEVLRVAEDVYELVSSGRASYAVRLARAPFAALAELVLTLAPTKTFLVFDKTVHGLYGRAARAALTERGLALGDDVLLEPGESEKRLATVESLLSALAAGGADRRSLVVSIGGGVTSDLAGFAAAIFARGVRWAAVPTTLLSMVDAAIGGKTGVDFAGVKNLVGAFHQPSGVIVSPTLARTESERAHRSGLAELVKSLAIGDAASFSALEALVEEGGAAKLEGDALARFVWASVRVKVDIVARDPLEAGDRAFLNFGHTLGHALESFGGLSRWTHGEAVALGIGAALAVGRALGITPDSVAARVVALLERLGLDARPSGADLKAALPLVSGDKKRVGSAVRFVLLRDLGKPLTTELSFDQLSRHVREMYP